MYLEGKSSLKSEKVVNRGELAFSFFFYRDNNIFYNNDKWNRRKDKDTIVSQ